MEPIMSELGIISDFLILSDKFSKVQGFLSGSEGYALMTLAERGHGVGAIVEVGSFMGLSTCWLATGSKNARRERVYAIDHFRGSEEHQAGATFEIEVIKDGGTTLPAFLSNLDAHKLRDYVVPIRKSSEDAAVDWTEPIRLLFIDADHSYEGVSRDFALFEKHIVSGGYLCFHDVGTYPGVDQLYEEICAGRTDYRLYFLLGSLAVFQKA